MRFFCLLILGMLSGFTHLSAQSGKLIGKVIDASTQEPLIGANILLVGTTQGATTNLAGDYVMLNVAPGIYNVRASYVGYEGVVQKDVEIFINRSRELNFKLNPVGVETQDIEIIAERPTVELDVGASQISFSAADLKTNPVNSISSVLGQAAGVSGLSVRGSGSDELLFNVDGISYRDPRTNQPVTSIGLVSVASIQLELSGFSADKGTVRSGNVEIVTKEGDPKRYEAEVISRYSPAAPKHYGAYANDPNSYWMRPFVDEAVCWTGTGTDANSPWSSATREQYPSFAGWNAVSATLLNDNNPNNDLTPEALRAAFLYQHRKDLRIQRPDQQLEVGFGGPTPILNKILGFGNTRFFASYLRNDEAYLIPLHTNNYENQSGRLQITSDVRKGGKLQISGMYGEEVATSASNGGSTGVFRSASGIAGVLTGVSFIDTRIFSTDYWAPTKVTTSALGLRYTQTFGSNAYLDFRASRLNAKYSTNPGRARDNSTAVVIGGVNFDEGPFGFEDTAVTGVDGMRMGVGMSTGRDSSKVSEYNFKADFTKQLVKTVEFKTGADFSTQDIAMNYGSYDAFLTSGNTQYVYNEAPARASAYALVKYESKGMYANIGLRGEFSDAKTQTFAFNPDTYYLPGWNTYATVRENIPQEAAKKRFSLSPRITFTFPITTAGKFLFNYGHFRSLPTPDQLFRLGYASESGRISSVANPSLPFPKTIAYEVGYEHVVNQSYLFRVSGYYKDITDESVGVTMVGNSRSNVNYTYQLPYSYADIRGAEVTIEKREGDLKGFVNYSYLANRSGRFGFPTYYQSSSAQAVYEQEYRNTLTQTGTVVVPSQNVKFNLRYNTPQNFRIRPLSNWLMSLNGEWIKAANRTWAGGGAAPPAARRNLKSADYFNLNVRISKSVAIGKQSLELFADVFNVFNTKRFSATGFFNGADQNDYLRSLHLPASEFYTNVPGNDKYGTYRELGVDFVRIKSIQNRTAELAPNKDDFYYERETQTYLVFQNGSWQDADATRVQEILKTKAYIDMPNQAFLTFLNPRDIYFGIRIKL